MKFSQFSVVAMSSLALIFLAPAISSSQPSDRLNQNMRSEMKSNMRANKPDLNLTEAQKQQMQSLKESTRTKINAVLTDAQRTQLEAAIKSGTKPRQAMRSLNLSADQKTRVRAIKEAVKIQKQALLTPEQKQKLQESRANRPDKRSRSKLSKLNLTEEQKQKMQAIRQNTQQKISTILTPEQKAQIKQSKASKNRGSDRKSLMASLNLQENQKAQIKTIREVSKKEIQSILTPTQLQEFNQMGERRGRPKN